MRRGRLLGTIGLCVGLSTGVLLAAEPAIIPTVPSELQPPAPPAQQPVRPTPPPTPVPPPPSTSGPALTAPPTVAPVSSALGAAPQSSTFAGAGFTPYMMGDLPASSYVRGMVCFPSLVPVFIPPVVQPPVLPPVRPPQDPIGGVGNAPQPGAAVVITPGQTIFVPGTVCRVVLIPQVSRGAVKIEENESPRPVDRVYVTYNYFNDVTRPFPGIPGSDLHRETYGVELTYLGGDASVGLRMNSLQTTGGSTFASGDFGDLTVITKFALVNNRDTGDVLSVGLAVTAPTGPDAVLIDGSRLNPVLLQPFTGFIYNWDRVYAQSFSSLIIPTDSNDVLLTTSSLGLGFRLYTAADPDARLSYITPIVEGHATIPVNHRGLSQTLVGFPDTFVLTNGLHVGLGSRANLAVGVAVPLTGPKIFDVEGIAQLNWKF